LGSSERTSLVPPTRGRRVIERASQPQRQAVDYQTGSRPRSRHAGGGAWAAVGAPGPLRAFFALRRDQDREAARPVPVRSAARARSTALRLARRKAGAEGDCAYDQEERTFPNHSNA